ncbi:F-box only protein 15 isoform X2 [Melanotaenia boesemani]|uniref:F-box only protein 15 isoform X2 n=1 Tax=Melanotaenia boesemani TaxID=1250792 RepID=UPI001C058D91|nr:F-box only protein 15 isoform X2 [Melanotaenia boesemani]
MATRRGQSFTPVEMTLNKNAVKQMAASKAAVSRLRAVRTSKRADKSSPASTHNFMESLPHEILIKILSYLDASALFSVSQINKLFYQLGNDNALWMKRYMAEFGKNKKQKTSDMDDVVLKMEEQDQAAGHWKWCYLTTVVARDTKWKRLLGSISCHTGLPSQTKQVLRNWCVTWELTITDKSGHESTLELSWSQFFETSLTLCWCGGGYLPDYEQISTLQLHGVQRNALRFPGLNKRSLMAKVDMPPLTVRAQVIGQDRLVQLKLLQPRIIIGVWRDQSSVAFIMFTLHFHRLVERSIQGCCIWPYEEPVVKPPFDDIDPEYGLHGYKLHIVLHDTVCELMSGSFSNLSCPRAQISDGLIQLTAISRTNRSQHTPLTGRVSLPWRCEALQGAIENCCIMSLTLLDEFRKPFRCVSCPVVMKPEKSPVSYDYYVFPCCQVPRDSETET